MRHALITGVSGFAGTHLARRLLANGWTVVGTSHRRSSGLAEVDEHRIEIDDAEALSGLVEQEQPTHVFHLAAIVDTVTTPDVMALYRANVLGTAAVLEAARCARGLQRVLVASSAFAYGRPPAGGRPVRESDPLVPLTPYGASKVAAEAIALQWGRSTGVDLVVTRAFQHTGAGHVGAYALADWAAQLAAGAQQIRVGNLDVERDYLDVRDVVAAYEALMLHGRPGGVYNVASGVPISMRSLLEGLIRAFDSDAEIQVDPLRVRKVDQPVFVADIEHLTTDTGWSPSHSIEETLAALASFWTDRYREQGSRTNPEPISAGPDRPPRTHR